MYIDSLWQNSHHPQTQSFTFIISYFKAVLEEKEKYFM